MYLRSAPEHTVEDLYDLIAPPVTKATVPTNHISVDLMRNSVINFRDEGGTVREVPANGNGVVNVGNWLGVPSQFLNRLDVDIQETLLNTMLARSENTATLSITDEDGLMDIAAPNHLHVDPRELVGIAAEVVGADASVVEWHREPAGYAFDVVVGADKTFGQGGDRAVGDITRGGLRFGQDTKKGLAPYVQPYLYRLICTNGMEVSDHSLRLDARRVDSMEGLIADLREKAFEAFAKVDTDIEAFYSLRNQRVVNPERTLIRLAGEHGISQRMLEQLLRDLPAYLSEDGTATQFDLVNLITNAANMGRLTNRRNARRSLEVIGGRITHDEAARCESCHSRLTPA